MTTVAPGGGTFTFTHNWATGGASDWPADVQSVVVHDGAVAYWVWGLGEIRDMHAAGNTETVIGTVVIA